MSSWYKDYLDSWATEDADQVLAWFTEDAVYEDTTLGHVSSGIDQVRRFVLGSFEKAPGVHFDLVSGGDDAQRFFIEWVMQPMALRGVSVGTVRDGKISSQRDYWDGKAFTI